MSLPRYPKYKDSGVDWLGGLPEHWAARRIRLLFEIRKRIAGVEGYDVLSITQQGIKIKDVESNDGQLSIDYSKYQFVEVGDFAMNHMDLLTGYVDISKSLGVTSPDYRVFCLRDPRICHDRYYLYIFQNAYKQRIFYPLGQGSSQLGRWRLPTEEFNNFVVPFPTLYEQKIIAGFLDRETRKIDVLVEEQRKLIELLKEKRRTVISHAVTKGLNPDAPVKDSGIEWLGDVPAHWEVYSLRHIVRAVFNGLSVDQIDEGENTVPVTRIETISKGVIDFERVGYIPSEDARPDRRLDAGDVLFSNINSLNMIGNCAQYLGNGLLFAGMNLLVLRPMDSVNPIWFYWLIKSPMFRQEVESLAKPAINQASISQTSLRNIAIVMPPYAEQFAIATYLGKQTAKDDELIAEATHAVDLLQERRTALISAAVTGKIDVRGLAKEDAA